MDNIFYTIFENQYFVFIITFISFFIKSYIFITLTKKSAENSAIRESLLLLLIILFTASFADFAWFFKLTQLLFIPTIDYRFVLFSIRLAWSLFIVQYQALTLFIENLASGTHTPLLLRQKAFIAISGSFSLFFLVTAFVKFNQIDAESRSLEMTLQQALSFYLLPLTLSTIYVTLYKIKHLQLPKILKKQLSVFLKTIFIPYWISDISQAYPFNVYPNWVTNSYAFCGLANIFLTLAIIFCAKKIMRLRFLNMHLQVYSGILSRFLEHFKHTFAQLSTVTKTQELKYITQLFLKEAFHIPIGKATLFIRGTQKETPDDVATLPCVPRIETFINTHAQAILEYTRQDQILVYDELVFSNFYEQETQRTLLIDFLQTFNADIFVPIYENNEIIAYILINKNARSNEFYSSSEQDEMLVFSKHLGSIITILQSKSIQTLTHHVKQLQEELYKKHREVTQYKESTRFFLSNNKQEHIGIIFYKNRQFTFGNQAAHELITINVNLLEGHPISKSLKQVAHHVEKFKIPHTIFIQDVQGNRLVLAGVPHLEHNQVIISVYYPDVSDILKKQLDMLHDPSEWDYLLYLETTQSGKLVNQLIPGTGQALIKFKIELLKAALNKKALLINAPEADLTDIVGLIHHLSLREKLHILNLDGHATTADIAIKLFGLNPLFGSVDTKSPLLKQLDGCGTLFIKNIHFLSLETQELLAEYLREGAYRSYKGLQKTPSDVRIFCSSSCDLQILIQENKFSKHLFAELKQTSLTMPCLTTLSNLELQALVDGYSEQICQGYTFKHMLTLGDHEREKINTVRPTSLHDLKRKIEGLLNQKSKQNGICTQDYFDNGQPITDPKLIDAARLGKYALKSPDLMVLLWDTFKNQNKIANFLGVNRSSVNRRCKEYNII